MNAPADLVVTEVPAKTFQEVTDVNADQDFLETTARLVSWSSVVHVLYVV